MPKSNPHSVQEQLLIVEQRLRDCKLWSETPPSATAMQSREPFCVDTMPLEAWLQWIFMPRLTEILRLTNAPKLPHNSDIHSMASHVFADYPQDTDKLLQAIKSLDNAINLLP